MQGPSLFNTLKGKSLFENKNSLFDKKKNNAPSIFEKSDKGIFGNLNKNSFLNSKTENQENLEDEQKVEEVDKTKFKVKFEYKIFYDVVIEKKVLNFKIGEASALGPGCITIEKSKDNEKQFVIAFRNKTQRMLHNSMLVPKMSDSKFIKNKKDAIILRSLSIEQKEVGKEGNSEKKEENVEKKTEGNSEEEKKEKNVEKKTEEKKTKLTTNFLKMKFESDKDAEEIKKELDKIYELA